MKNNKKFEKHVKHAIGSLERPMSDADLEAKFRGLADGVLSRAEADKLIALCWKIESQPEASALARAAVPGKP